MGGGRKRKAVLAQLLLMLLLYNCHPKRPLRPAAAEQLRRRRQHCEGTEPSLCMSQVFRSNLLVHFIALIT